MECLTFMIYLITDDKTEYYCLPPRKYATAQVFWDANSQKWLDNKPIICICFAWVFRWRKPNQIKKIETVMAISMSTVASEIAFRFICQTLQKLIAGNWWCISASRAKLCDSIDNLILPYVWLAIHINSGSNLSFTKRSELMCQNDQI